MSHRKLYEVITRNIKGTSNVMNTYRADRRPTNGISIEFEILSNSFGSDNGLTPPRRQAIVWTNAS